MDKKLELHFAGFQDDGYGGKFALWNIINSPRPDLHPDNSTVTMVTVNEMLRTVI